MDDPKRTFSVERPRAALVTGERLLSDSLARKFLESGLAVDVYAEREAELRKKISRTSRHLSFYKLFEGQGRAVDYVVCLTVNNFDEVFDKDFLLRRKKSIIFAAGLAKRFSAKCIFVLPFVQDKETGPLLSSWLKELLSDDRLFAGVVYVGELVSEEEDFIGNNGLAKVLRSLLWDNPLTLRIAERHFYPIRVDDAAEEITHMLFSLKAYATETAVISAPLKAQDMLQFFKKINYSVKLFKEQERNIKTARAREFVYKKFDYQEFISKLASSRVKNQGAGIDKKKKALIGAVDGNLGKKKSSLIVSSLENSVVFLIKLALLPRPRTSLPKNVAIKRKPFILLALAGALSFFLAPWIFTIITLLSLGIARNSFHSGSTFVVDRALDVASSGSWMVVKHSQTLSGLPIVGKEYERTQKLGNLLLKTSKLGEEAASLKRETLMLLGYALDKDSKYDPDTSSEKIYLDLDSLYNQLGFLQGEIDNNPGIVSDLIKGAVGVSSVQEIRQKTAALKSISSEIPEILGKGKPKTYLVLFQDSSVLRPTGGSIEAFAMLTFIDGKLADSEIYESSFADQKLRGLVDPPDPIKKYFDKGNWSLKDSNWDPDFIVSATKAEWFIDKELDRSFDGVVGVDVEFLDAWSKKAKASILQGLVSWGTSQDLFKIFWQRNSSNENSNVVLEGAKDFLGKITKMSTEERVELLDKTLKSLDDRHIQVFLHDANAQRALSDLRWDGELYQEVCSDNCYSDFVGIIESSTEDSFPGNLIKREADLTVSLEEGLIKRRLVFFLDNPQATGGSVYKSYVRVLTPGDSGFGPVELLGAAAHRTTTPEVSGIRGHKEAGIYIELSPGETKALVFSWESGTGTNFDSGGKYLFYFRRQAGVLEYPTQMRFRFPERITTSTVPTPSLTEVGEVGYNTLLSRDFVSRIFW